MDRATNDNVQRQDGGVFSLVTTFIDGFGFITRNRDQLQDERTPLAIQVLHHEDVTSTLNLKTTSWLALHSFAQLEARKMWPYATP